MHFFGCCANMSIYCEQYSMLVGLHNAQVDTPKTHFTKMGTSNINCSDSKCRAVPCQASALKENMAICKSCGQAQRLEWPEDHFLEKQSVSCKLSPYQSLYTACRNKPDQRHEAQGPRPMVGGRGHAEVGFLPYVLGCKFYISEVGEP